MRVKKFSRTTSKKPMPELRYTDVPPVLFGFMVMFLIAQILLIGAPVQFLVAGASVLAFYGLLHWWVTRKLKKRTSMKARVVAIVSAVSMVVYCIALLVTWMGKHSGVRPQTTDTMMGYSEPPRVPAPSDIGDYTNAFPDV